MILLDTQVLLWLSFDYGNLGRRAHGAIDRAWARGNAAVSAITFWEVGMLHARGKLRLMSDIDQGGAPTSSATAWWRFPSMT